MAAHLTTADEYEVSSKEDRDYYAGVCGSGLIVLPLGNKMAATINATNVSVSDGVALLEGGRIQIDYGDAVTFTIPTGTSGVVSTYYIGFKIDTDGACDTFVQTTKPTSTSIRQGSSETYATLYKVTQNGTSISDAEKLFDEVYSLSELAALMETRFTETYKKMIEDAVWQEGACTTSNANVEIYGTNWAQWNGSHGTIDVKLKVTTNFPAGYRLLWTPITGITDDNGRMVPYVNSNGDVGLAELWLDNDGSLYAKGTVASGTVFFGEYNFTY